MKSVSKVHTSKLMLALILAGASYAQSSMAGQFNALIGNPFVFCSLPKPCKYCQPYRRIYSEICGSQKNALKDANLVAEETAKELAERNKRMTAAMWDKFQQEGAEALGFALQRGDMIFPMDENTSDLSFNAFAIGWNSEWLRLHPPSDDANPSSGDAIR